MQTILFPPQVSEDRTKVRRSPSNPMSTGEQEEEDARRVYVVSAGVGTSHTVPFMDTCMHSECVLSLDPPDMYMWLSHLPMQKGFPADVTLDQLEEFFDPFGQVRW